MKRCIDFGDNLLGFQGGYLQGRFLLRVGDGFGDEFVVNIIAERSEALLSYSGFVNVVEITDDFDFQFKFFSLIAVNSISLSMSSMLKSV